jgi:serralysin
MLGSDAALKALEPTLHQDLNGDGAVGTAPWTDGFVFNSVQGGSSSSSTPDVPDPMPDWVGAQATPSVSAFAETLANHDATAHVSPVDLLHHVLSQGILLA